jgi:hypothetical protein
MLQPREELLLPIVHVPRELFVRHEFGTHHLLFLLRSLILIGRSWECRFLEQVEQVFRQVVARSELQPARTTTARAQPGDVVQHRDGMCDFDFNTRFDGHDEPLEVDWAILFDRLDGPPCRLEIRVFPIYRVEITAAVGAENANGREVLDLPLEDFDFSWSFRFRLAIF